MGDQKIKTAAGKIPMNLIPLRVLKGVARVFGYGAKKYAKGNWYTATDDDFTGRYPGGGLRHLADAQNLDGTFDFASLAKLDDESGLPEIDHLLCGLIMLRGLLIKRGILPEDPGVGFEPLKAPTVDPTAKVTWPPMSPAQSAIPLHLRSTGGVEDREVSDHVLSECDCRDCDSFRMSTTCDLRSGWNVPVSDFAAKGDSAFPGPAGW